MKRLLFLLPLILLATTAGFAQTHRVLHLATGTPADPGLQDVLTRAIGLELLRAGLAELAYDPAVDGEPTAESLQAAAIAESADYILLLVYEEDSAASPSSGTTELKIALTVQQTAGGTMLYESEFSSPVDLALDSRVAAALRAVVAETGIGGERVTEAADTAQAASGGLEDTSIASTTATNQIGQPLPIRVVDPPTGIGTSVTGAPIIVVGGAADWFRYGYSASLVVDYRFAVPGFGIAAGLRTAFSQLFPAAATTPGLVLLATMGPNVSIGTIERSPVRLSGHVSGGPAVLMIEPEGSDFQAKLIPYLFAGVEANVGIGSSFFLGIEVNYMIALEGTIPIMGLVPSIVIGLGP